MSRPDERTSVTVVTGFLGSGKTTLLNRALRSPQLANAAVIINEFGSVSLDHLLCEASSDQIVVLKNGCLCCTVFGDLIATLNRLYHAREAGEIPQFDHVAIETSGLADPRSVFQAFLSDPTLEGLYRLDSVLAVVDAVNGPGTLERHSESVHQIALADSVIITKLEMLGAEQSRMRKAELSETIRSINRGVGIYCTDDEQTDPTALILSRGFSLRRDSKDVLAWLNPTVHSGHSSATDPHTWPQAGTATRIESFCFVRKEATSLYGLELLLAAVERNLGPSLLRVKGLIHVKERPDRPAVIHGAQHLLHNLIWLDQWPNEDRSTQIIFITEGISRMELQDMVSVLDSRSAGARIWHGSGQRAR